MNNELCTASNQFDVMNGDGVARDEKVMSGGETNSFSSVLSQAKLFLMIVTIA